MGQILTERIFEASLDSRLDCMYKCRLLLNGKRGNKTEYEDHIDRFAATYRRAAIAKLQDTLWPSFEGVTKVANPKPVHSGFAKWITNGSAEDATVRIHEFWISLLKFTCRGNPRDDTGLG